MTNASEDSHPLVDLEAHLRPLLPSTLYADVWINPSGRNLTKVFNHLRTLQRILYNYLPRQVLSSLPMPGENRSSWEEGTLMFTDLAGFTPLLEASAEQGQAGAAALWELFNDYFTEIISIVGKGGGNLLEFTGDAILVQFKTDQQQNDTARAVRVGLRMQRAMERFSDFEILDSKHSLGMRVGLHVGKFLTSDLGTPHRMEHVLLGSAVQASKLAEGAGKVGYVCLSEEAAKRVEDQFSFTQTSDGMHRLVVDDLSAEQLGDYDIVPTRHKLASMVLFDMSVEGLIQAIEGAVEKVEPLASFIPRPILNMLVENAVSRRVPPDFPETTIMFVNLLGLPPLVDNDDEDENKELRTKILATFSQAISLINAEVESEGGIMKKVTYHLSGPDIMIVFGVPNAHTNDSIRAAKAAISIRKMVNQLSAIQVNGEEQKITCHIGMTRGRVFAAEFGETQGRREFNVMGDKVNTAARLMHKAESDQILLSDDVLDALEIRFDTIDLGEVALKGKSKVLSLYSLNTIKK